MSKSHHTKVFTLRRLSSIRNTIPENQSCCECSASNPDWAFLLTLSTTTDNKEDDDRNIGAFICSNCSSAHQKLNERLGSVKSLADVGSWTAADVQAMARGGNDVINQVFEHSIINNMQQHLKSTIKPTESSDITERRLFLELKYGTRKFYSADAATRLIPPSPNNATSGMSDEPSGNSRRDALSGYRQMSMPTMGISSPSQKTPSRSGRRGVRRVHSNDDWELHLSPVSTGVYSMSMSTISTKSTLFGGGKHNKVQIIKEPVGGRLDQSVSLGSFIEATNNSSPDLHYYHNNNNHNHQSKNNTNNPLDLNNTPPILETVGRGASMREFNLEENHRDTRPKMCRRVQSSRTLRSVEDGGYSQSQEGNGSRHSRSTRSGGRRTKSLDTDEVFGTMETDPTMDDNAERRSRRGSMGSTQQHQQQQQQRRRRGSMGSTQQQHQQQQRRRRGSMGSTQQQQSSESGRPVVRRRGSVGTTTTTSTKQPLSLDSGSSVVRRRGSMGGSRRMSSMERVTGQHRANLSRRNLSLDSDDIMGSPRVQTSIAMRRGSLTESTPSQRERPKYTRNLSSSSIMDDSEQGMMMAPERPHNREPWMEGKTPRTTGRRKSLGMDSAPSRKNPFNGGMKNPMDRSERSQSREPSATRAPRRNSLLGCSSNHGAAPGVLRRARSKRNFARSSSGRSIMSNKDELNDDSERSTANRSISSNSLHKRQGGLISGDKRSRGLESLRGSLGGRKSTDSDLTSSRLGSTTQNSKPSSNVAVAAGASRTSSNDLGSKLDLIDKESASGYDVFDHEHKSPTSPLTTSTGSKRIPRSLHVVLHAQDDETRTFVSTVTGNSSLESSWSLHKERWKA